MMSTANAYDATSDADIIICSSDNVEFFVLGAFLRYVSPVFKDMFALSQSDADAGRLPVVQLAEDSKTLRLLLDLIYPSEQEPQLNKPAVVWNACKATRKYGMKVIENKLRRQIIDSDLMHFNSLNMYAIATDLGWEEMVMDAAQRTLGTPLKSLLFAEELKGITGADFYRFLAYRFRCEVAEVPLSEVLIPQPRELPSQPPAPGSFSPSETASVILRARDSVDFFVADVILRLTSPFFNCMFPLQNPEFKDGWPIIEVDEDSLVLSQLLSFIYPCVEEPDIQDYQLYTRTVLAARKYEMMSIEPKLRRRASTSMVTAEPLCMYAVASALGWDDLAKHAALNTFHQPFQDMCFVDELYLITGADLYRLMRFRFSCADAACHALKADNRFAKYGFGEWSAYYKKRIVSWNAPDSEDDTWNRRHSHDPRATEMILIDALYAFGRLQACPRGLTVGDIYQHQLSKMAEKQGGRFEMEPSTFFNIFMCMQEAPRIVEDAVSRVPLPCL